MFKAVILLVCFLAATQADEKHYINDCLNPGKKPVILFNQEISKEGKFFQTQEETIRIPENGFAPDVINCIQVTNLQSDADGGYPKVQTGGIGSNYVTIHFKSQFNKGYDFEVLVYYKGQS